MTATATRNPFSRAVESEREASGYVALDNLDDVRTLLDRLLGKRQRHTHVRSYEYANYRPEVLTGLRAESITVHRHGEGDTVRHGAVQVVDGRNVWSLSTSLPTQPTVAQMHDDGPGGALRQGCHLHINDREAQVRLRTPEGRLAWWHVQLEQSDWTHEWYVVRAAPVGGTDGKGDSLFTAAAVFLTQDDQEAAHAYEALKEAGLGRGMTQVGYGGAGSLKCEVAHSIDELVRKGKGK